MGLPLVRILEIEVSIAFGQSSGRLTLRMLVAQGTLAHVGQLDRAL